MSLTTTESHSVPQEIDEACLHAGFAIASPVNDSYVGSSVLNRVNGYSVFRTRRVFASRCITALCFVALLSLWTFSGVNSATLSAAEGVEQAQGAHADAEHDSHGNHAAGHDDHHGDGHHGEHHGKPPLAEDLAFWSIIAFAGFCFAIVKLGLWDSLKRNMGLRETRERNLIAQAESKLAEAEAAARECRGRLEAMDETIREIMAEAGRDADYTRSDILSVAQREADVLFQRANHDISRVKDQTLHDLFTHLANRVSQAAEERMRTQLQSADQDRLIEETLNQLVSS